MGYITKKGLENLKNYKYVSGGYSFVDKIMNHWWELFLKLFIPMVRPKLNMMLITSIIEHGS